MPGSHRLAFLVPFVLACHAAPTVDPPAASDSIARAEVQPETEATVEPEDEDELRSQPPAAELLAERNTISTELARIDAEIAVLEEIRRKLRTQERELRSAKSSDDPALQAVLVQLDTAVDAIALLRTEQASHQVRAADLDWAIERQREDECGQPCTPQGQFRVRR